MFRWVKTLLAASFAVLLMGCVQQANVPNYDAAATIGPTSGYRANDTGREPGKEPSLRHTYFVLAFSGGGTRAAAFAQGALRELGATPSFDAPELTLLEAVDMISSTSGGSVTAANFVLRGPSGYRFLDQNGGFLGQNGMTDLILGTLDPLDIAERTVTEKSRIQLLSAWFQRALFRDWTFETIAQQKFRRPPLLVLNSADMATGEPFPFTQKQLDRLCIDLRQVKLADAVSASAAFPVALTPLRLPDLSPCKAQMDGPGRTVVRSFINETEIGPAARAKACRDGWPVLNTGVADFRSRGLRQYQLLNLDECGQPLPPDSPARVRYVHLLDGGMADNVGLGRPLETLTSQGDDPRVAPAIEDGTIGRVVVIAVDARSQPSTTIGRNDSTPGLFSMLGAVISSAIDARSAGLSAQLNTLREVLTSRYAKPPEVSVIPVDFELIADPKCRAAFQGLGTNWSLSEREVTALQEMASAILRATPAYLKLTHATDDGTGQRRGAASCQRLAGSEVGPPTFGAGPAL